MARNEEKALTLFNKWQTFKQDYHSSVGNRRPLLASECISLSDAEKCRRDIVREATKKISAIHNASLGEHRIRELNDEINKMMKQKHYWEIRMRELGGDTTKGRQFLDIEGKELPGAPGYRYYGAAKDLPGVRELFAERNDELEIRKQKRSRVDIYRNVTPDYYGYRDDDDGILFARETIQEKELLSILRETHQYGIKTKESFNLKGGENEEISSNSDDDADNEDTIFRLVNEDRNGIHATSVVIDNSSQNHTVQREIDIILMEKKKKQLLEKMQLY